MAPGLGIMPMTLGDDPLGSGSVRGRPQCCGRGGVMPWIALIIAGLFEIGWAIGLKYTDGFTRLWPSVGTLLAMAISFALLSYAMKTLPVGTAYAVWTGIGAVGTVLF